VMRAVMILAGVIDTDMVKMDWPDWPAGISDERGADLTLFLDEGEDVEPPITASERTAMEEFRRRHDEVLATRSPKKGLVGAAKFLSNDGWLVTPDECTAIAEHLTAGLNRSWHFLWFRSGIVPPRALTNASFGETRDWIANWAHYNGIASSQDGYRVW